MSTPEERKVLRKLAHDARTYIDSSITNDKKFLVAARPPAAPPPPALLDEVERLEVQQGDRFESFMTESKLQTKLEACRAENAKLAVQWQEIKAENKRLGQQLEDVVADRNRRVDERDKYHAENKRLEKEVAKAHEFIDYAAELDRARGREYEKAISERNEARAEIEGLVEELEYRLVERNEARQIARKYYRMVANEMSPLSWR